MDLGKNILGQQPMDFFKNLLTHFFIIWIVQLYF